MTEKEKALQEINRMTVQWVKENPGPYDRRKLANLVQMIAATDAYKTAVADFHDKAAYPTRPMVEAGWFEGCGVPKKQVPVLWLLGWRKGEATPIHDHVASEVGITVTSGAIGETIFWPENSEPLGEGFHGSCRQVTRELLAGSTALVPAPYIHRFEGTDICDCGVSLHAYWPRLVKMNYYELTGEGDQKQLVFSGSWADEG